MFPIHRTWNVFQQDIVLQFTFCFLRQGSPSVSCAVNKGNISSLFYLTIIPLTKKKIATIITCCLPIIFYKASPVLVMPLCLWLIILTLGKKADCAFSTYHTNATWPAGGMLRPIIAQTGTRSMGAAPTLCYHGGLFVIIFTCVRLTKIHSKKTQIVRAGFAVN